MSILALLLLLAMETFVRAWWVTDEMKNELISDRLVGTHLNILLANVSASVMHFPGHSHHAIGMVPSFLAIMKTYLGFTYTLWAKNQVCPVYCCLYDCAHTSYPTCVSSLKGCVVLKDKMSREYVHNNSFQFFSTQGDHITFDLISEYEAGENIRARNPTKHWVSPINKAIGGTGQSTFPVFEQDLMTMVLQRVAVPDYWNAFRPFHYELWIGIICCTLVMAALRLLVTNTVPRTAGQVLETVTAAWGALLGNGDDCCTATAAAARILGVGWLFFILVITNTYTANLASVLIMPDVTIVGPQTLGELKSSTVCFPYISDDVLQQATSDPARLYAGERLGDMLQATINAGYVARFVAPAQPDDYIFSQIYYMNSCAQMLKEAQSNKMAVVGFEMDLRQFLHNGNNCNDFSIR